MRLVIIGGTGVVGSKVVDEALVRGHEVTMVVRAPEGIIPRPNLRPVAGDAHVPGPLVELFRGHDASVGAFHPEGTSPDLYDEYLRVARATLSATKQAGVPRLLWVGGAGSLEVAPGVQLVDTPEFPRKFKAGALAARETLRLLQQEHEVDWVVLSPAIHVEEGPRTAIYRTGGDAPVYGAHHDSHISVQDLAVAVVDELERPRHHRHRFTVGY